MLQIAVLAKAAHAMAAHDHDKQAMSILMHCFIGGLSAAPVLGAQGHAEALCSSQRSTATSMAAQWVCPSTMISRMPDSCTSRVTSAATAGVAKLPFDLQRALRRQPSAVSLTSTVSFLNRTTQADTAGGSERSYAPLLEAS